MKKVFRLIFSILFNTLTLPCLLASTLCVAWYLLSGASGTEVGKFILGYVNDEQIFIISICIWVFTVLCVILGKILTLIKSSKILNFQTHVITWILSLAMVAETSYVFIVTESFSTMEIDLSNIRKISVGIIILFMFIYTIITPKVKVLVNRRIQAYDTAKELNMKARSSSVFMHLLKAIDFLCPELLLLVLLCFVFNLEVSIYFIYLLIALVSPIIGNIICDRRVKKEYDRKVRENQQATAKEVIKQLSSSTK